MIKNFKFKISNSSSSHNTYYISHTTNQSGYTLIEILIAVSIFALVIGMVLAVFITNQKVQSKVNATRDTAQTLRIITDTLAREVQLATGCVTSGVSPVYYNTLPITFNNNILTLSRYDAEQKKCLTKTYSLNADGAIIVVNENNVSDTLNNVSNVKITEWNIKLNDYLKTGCEPTHATVDCIIAQPSFQVNIMAKYSAGSGKTSEKSTQTLETAFTTRNYPGFNDISQ